MSSLPIVKPITTVEQLSAVRERAALDDHYVLAPTHFVEKNGEVAGYWSVNGIPNVHLWHDSKLITARDSTHLSALLDHTAMEKGASSYILYCANNSPYHPHMDRFGFRGGFSTNLFIKEIK